jgi:DmsE family decaheme c-type cytochrome
MSKYIRKIGQKHWVIFGIALWVIALVGLRASTPAGPAKAIPTAEKSAVVLNPQQSDQAAGWSVSDCQTCHEAVVGDAFQHSGHGKQDHSCATCHTGVAEHAKAQMTGGTAPTPTPTLKNLKAQDLNAVCLKCHEKNNQANFVSSMHARRNVACTSCHGIHSYKSEKAQLKTVQDTETCYTCHPAMRAKMNRTSHHPVREGKLTCASCHNPHDGSREHLLKADTVNELCYKCHTEKRGPYLYEHAPVREDCVSCHDPHGSNHDRLLVAKAPFLCQRCHYSGHGLTGDRNNTQQGVAVAATPPAGVTTAQTTRSSRQMERACINCHYNIHGSNSASGWAFVR